MTIIKTFDYLDNYEPCLYVSKNILLVLQSVICFLAQAIYIIINFIALLQWISLSKRWKIKIQEIESMEKSLEPLTRPNQLHRAVKTLLVSILVAGLSEYAMYTIFYLMKSSTDHSTQITEITVEKNAENKTKTENSGMFVGVFQYFPYWILFIRLEISMVQTIVVYGLTDTLLLTVSIYLIHRFQDYNELLQRKLRELRKNISSSATWLELQKRYTTLTLLVKAIDEMVQPYVFLSFSLNLIRIGQQIYFIFRKQLVKPLYTRPEEIDVFALIYLSLSVIFVATRAVIVSLTAAHVHTLSRKPLGLLHSVPSRSYDYEVQKFMDQVFHSKVCLSGLGFFHVTRGMILTMVATLLTYELMLIQFVGSTGN